MSVIIATLHLTEKELTKMESEGISARNFIQIFEYRFKYKRRDSEAVFGYQHTCYNSVPLKNITF